MQELAYQYLRAVWGICIEMAPWLLLGFLVAGFMKFFLRDEWIQKHLGHKGWRGATMATLWGIPLPLCSCGVLPVAISFKKRGASNESTIGFLSSTPQTGVDSFLVTLGMLGPHLAILRVISAFVSGILAGKIAGNINNSDANKECGSTSSCCGGHDDEVTDHGEETRTRIGFWESMRYGFWEIPKEIQRALIIGIALGGLLGMLGEQEHLTRWFQNPVTGYIVAIVLAIPMYTCSTGSIPLAAGLVSLGATPGAAIIFLILGPATNIITLTSISTLIGRKATTAYVVIVSFVGLVSGVVGDIIGMKVITSSAHIHGSGDVDWFKTVLTILFLGLLGATLLPKMKKSEEKTHSCCGGDD